jgi:hypothetical protein
VLTSLHFVSEVTKSTMQKNGDLQIAGGLSFLNPEHTQLVMRNLPVGGTFDQRAAAATAFLTGTVHANDGDAITVTGAPDGATFLVDSAVLG